MLTPVDISARQYIDILDTMSPLVSCHNANIKPNSEYLTCHVAGEKETNYLVISVMFI